MTQAQALQLLKMGRNIFITGPAGSGKTHLLKEYILYLRNHHIPVAITASTGIAATHIGGMTIHSWSGIGIKDYLSVEDIYAIADKAYVRKKIEEAKVLIIDEISMLHHYRLDMIDRVLKHIKKSSEPFGGMQIVLCGDFFQLPPVTRMGDQEALFAFESQSWKDAKIFICYLEGNWRQGDDHLALILNEIRSGEVGEGARNLLKDRHNTIISSIEETGIEPTRLYTHNIDVDSINEKALNKVQAPEAIYEMSSKGRKPIVEALKKSCLAPEKLRLRKGARVMCVKNNMEQGYVNGTLGVVVSCGFGIDPVIRTAGTTDYPEGRLITVERAVWVIDDEGRSLAEIHQYPLRLAWAITVHKSQGMSLDAVEVDLSRCFEPGMGYVALSRARSLAGLSILGINEKAFSIHPEVYEFDRFARELSLRAESVLIHSGRDDIEQAEKEFLAKSAPLHKLGKKSATKKDASFGRSFPKKITKKKTTKRPFRPYTRTVRIVD